MKPLGNRRKRYALVVIAVGIYTFFVPFVIVDPPVVLNRTEWSPLNIASQVYQRKLPVPQGRFIGLIYLFLPFALVALYLPGSPKALTVISAIGFALSSLAKWWNITLHWTFGYYGHMQQWHMRPGPAWWVLPWIMPAIMIICLVDRLDA